MHGLIIIIVFVAIVISLFIMKERRIQNKRSMPSNFRELLHQNVVYYSLLTDADKLRFEEKIKDFLSYVNIHGVNTPVDWLDKLLVASSAVIPVFGFDTWRYFNVRDVLLYEDAFNKEDFSTKSAIRNTTGMVGTGALQQMMILSKSALHAGFRNTSGKYNTGIHEFVHLIDKADGDTDGIPEQLLGTQNISRWINAVNKETEEIKKGGSDIDAYAATNKAEFFAVVSEYFFQRPDLFAEYHPDLFELMTEIFRQVPLYYFTHYKK